MCSVTKSSIEIEINDDIFRVAIEDVNGHFLTSINLSESEEKQAN